MQRGSERIRWGAGEVLQRRQDVGAAVEDGLEGLLDIVAGMMKEVRWRKVARLDGGNRMSKYTQ